MKARNSRQRSCQVLLRGTSSQRLWSFSVAPDKVSKTSEVTVPLGTPFPPSSVRQDWRLLVQPRINIACLPSGLVFIRLIHLPSSSADEIPGMVEFELEKLSPLPPAQVVWTFEVLDQTTEGLSAILVVVAARNAVEEFLGGLEGDRYIADRLEVPLVRELRYSCPTQDGIWILVEDGDAERTVLVAWRAGGIWRELIILRLEKGGAAAEQLTQQLSCAAWGGEMAGWLESVPSVRFIGSPEAAHSLVGAIEKWRGEPVHVEPHMNPEALALEAARFHLLPSSTSLVPPEVTARHRNQLIDRLWIKGLGNIGGMYLFCVFCYILALKFQEHRLDDTQSEAVALGKSYTNTLQLKEKVEIIQSQIDLRFAALNAWRAAVERLPESMTLTSLSFEKGRTLKLLGTVPTTSQSDVIQFNSDLMKARVDGQPLFGSVKPANFRSSGASSTWDFDAELRRTETP